MGTLGMDLGVPAAKLVLAFLIGWVPAAALTMGPERGDPDASCNL